MSQQLNLSSIVTRKDVGVISGNQDGVNNDIWAMIEHPIEVDAVCNQLLQAYEVNPAPCRQKVLEYLRGLLLKGLLEVRAAS